jgi:hypothetical protein
MQILHDRERKIKPDSWINREMYKQILGDKLGDKQRKTKIYNWINREINIE